MDTTTVTTRSASTLKLDLIGDIHGELPALEALLRALGYGPEAAGQADDVPGTGPAGPEGPRPRAWVHPEGRVLVFLGDLVDRGSYSLQVAQLVQRMVEAGQAMCLMGNHEYNLVGWNLQLERFRRPKPSNKATTAEIETAREAWDPVLAFFQRLPLTLELPTLRVVHACWHLPSLGAIGERLRAPEAELGAAFAGWDARSGDGDGDGESAPAAPLWQAVKHFSPFGLQDLREGLPGQQGGQDDPPHAILIKGHEEDTEPFPDSEGRSRKRARVTWWSESPPLVPTDRLLVVGHYWNLPPLEGDFMPPFPTGSPALRSWQTQMLADHPELLPGSSVASGVLELKSFQACVDFQGLTLASGSFACIGALRWPERQIVWGSAARD